MNVYFHVAGIMYALLLHFFGHVAQFFELNSVGGVWGYIYNREITAKRNKWRGKTDKGKKDAAKPKVASFPRPDYRLRVPGHQTDH